MSDLQILEIITGPSKFDLMMAHYHGRGHDLGLAKTVEFDLRFGLGKLQHEAFRFPVHGVTAIWTYEMGEEWEIVGYVPDEIRRRAKDPRPDFNKHAKTLGNVHGYFATYNTQTRKGSFKLLSFNDMRDRQYSPLRRD